jgi:hypothetical protein
MVGGFVRRRADLIGQLLVQQAFLVQALLQFGYSLVDGAHLLLSGGQRLSLLV